MPVKRNAENSAVRFMEAETPFLSKKFSGGNTGVTAKTPRSPRLAVTPYYLHHYLVFVAAGLGAAAFGAAAAAAGAGTPIWISSAAYIFIFSFILASMRMRVPTFSSAFV